MATFSYMATDKSGSIIKGTVAAEDRSAALASLKKQELQPISLKQVADAGTSSILKLSDMFKSKGVKSDALVIFTRELATMTGAGVPLLKSLTSLKSHTDSKPLTQALEGVIRDVEAGKLFGEALAKHPAIFSDIYVNMVRAGEAAGILDEVLNRLAAQQENSATIRKKVKSAMAYPMVLVTIMTIAFFGLMLFVVPQIAKIVKDLGGPDAELPLITQVMLGIGGFLINFYWL